MSEGPSPASASREGSGIGLSNTQARLRHLYGEQQRFEFTGRDDGGGALVELPFHLEPLEHGTAQDSHR